MMNLQEKVANNKIQNKEKPQTKEMKKKEKVKGILANFLLDYKCYRYHVLPGVLLVEK